MRHYNQNMRNANTKGADKYFHALANCQAGQHYGIPEAIKVSLGRELLDSTVKNPLIKHLKLKDNIEDCTEDLKADLFGLLKGVTNPQGNCKLMVEKYRPVGLDKRY